jgi:hypothetical protein
MRMVSISCRRAVRRCKARAGLRAATDLVTRILKEYGDFLDRHQPAPDRPPPPAAAALKQLHVVRSVMLLIELTGEHMARPRAPAVVPGVSDVGSDT